MKKFLLSFLTMSALALYIVFTRNSDISYVAPTSPAKISEGNLGGQAPSSASSNPAPAAPPIPSAQTKKPAAVNPTPAPARTYNDGAYVGGVADAYYGNVQVKITIQNDKITDIQFLQYPSDRSTSRYINSQAMPYLIQEAIQAQSANVDIVSGATATSGAFQESLASALTQAKI